MILARRSPRAVVIRRGPSKTTAIVGWDRDTDRFELGQWLRGHIYERRCDLSPNGEHLIYFAMDQRRGARRTSSWTAISRTPYLKAVAMFAKGDGWHGGGLFATNRDYWLNDGYGHEEVQRCSSLRRITGHPWPEQYGGECPGVYFIRLQRDGWTMQGVEAMPGDPGGRITVFTRRINDRWQLRKRAHATINRGPGRGCYYDTHELVDLRGGAVVPRHDWEWADIDRDRLVWAAAGRIHAGRVDADGLRDERVLFDAHGMTFEARPAPY